MEATIINGHKIAKKIKDSIVKDIVELNGGERSLQAEARADFRPNLAIVLIGEREDSKLYVNLKDVEAKKVGIDTHLYKFPDTTSEEEVIQAIKYLNQDKQIDAILVQLPLPSGYNTNKVIRSIDPEKDLDRFHPKNQKIILASCAHEQAIPPVAEAVLSILKEIKQKVETKKVCIISNSKVFGACLAKILECRGGQVKVLSSQSKNLVKETKKADLIITALGKPNFLKTDMVKPGVIIIDIGIKKQGKKVLGDTCFEEMKKKAGYLTPVPGGVGPITIATALKGTLDIYKKRNKQTS